MVQGFKDSSSSIHKLLEAVGITRLPIDWRQEPQHYYWQERIDTVNTVGVGTIYPQITYWKKGFEDFLLDFRDILQAECSL
jgi:hypothetical protein